MDNIKTIDIDDLAIAFIPPEYLIIRKLEFFRESGSQKHLRDIAAMLAESSDIIDQSFLQKQITNLNLSTHYQAAEALVKEN